MSGRGRGRGGYRNRGRGRGGSGRSSNRSNQSSVRAQHTPSTKKTINDCSYGIGSPHHASEFTSTTEFIINYVRQKYGPYMADSLEERAPVELVPPVLEESIAVDAEVRARENRNFMSLHNARLN
eukprot:scaffold18778_cov154-Amphora_coffeaeformis.AAC.1